MTSQSTTHSLDAHNKPQPDRKEKLLLFSRLLLSLEKEKRLKESFIGMKIN
jgi:hypothetical protein